MKKKIVLSVLAFFVCASQVSADEVEALKAQLEAMQVQMARMSERIEQLEAERTQRLESPEHVEDRVAKIEKSLKESTLGKLSSDALKIGGFLQSYYRWGEHSDDNDTFDIRRARVMFTGDLTPELSYGFVLDFKDAAKKYIMDAVIRYKFMDELRISAGQMVIPFSYEHNQSTTNRDVIVGSRAVSAISPDRDMGVMADGELLDKRIYYALGVFNGTGRNLRDSNKNKDIIGRFIVSPFRGMGNDLLEGFSLGGAYHYGRQKRSGDNNDGLYEGKRHRAQGLLLYEYDKLKLTGEYIYQERERFDRSIQTSHGWYATATYMILENVRAVARIEQFDPDTSISNDRIDILTLGGRYSINKYLDIDANYRHIMEQGTNANNNEFIVQGQVKF